MPKKKDQRNKILVAVAVALVLLFGTILFLRRTTSNFEEHPQALESQETVNYGPATEEEKQQAINNKKRIGEEQAGNQLPTGAKRIVKPTINFVEQNGNQVELGAFVPGVFEDGGQCKASFTKDGNTISKMVIASKEGSATYCPIISIPVSEFPEKSEWSAVISYDSPSSSGVSDSSKFEIK